MKFSLLNIETDYKNDANIEKVGRTILLIFSFIFSIIVGAVLCYYFLMPHWATILHNSVFLDNKNLSSEELETISTLVTQNKIHTLDFVVERLISFYETQVQHLVGIFAIFGMIGFFSIKCSHKRDIAEELQEYMNSNTGKLLLQNLVKDYIKNENIRPLVDEAFNRERNENGIISEMYDAIASLEDKNDELLKEQTNLSVRLDSLNISSEAGEINFPEQVDEKGE